MISDNGGCKKCNINGFGASKGKLKVDNSEFCVQLRHIKCKVANLAREQMKKNMTGVNNHMAEYVYYPRNMIHYCTSGGASRGTSYFESELSDENSSAFDDRRRKLYSPAMNSNDTVDTEGPTSSVERTVNDPILEPNQSPVFPKYLESKPNHRIQVPGSKFFEYWIEYISQYTNKRKRILVVAVIIGILIWMALVYGAIIGASLCNSGQYPSFQFSTSRTRASVF